MSRTITLKPRLNEKTYGLAASRVYVFEVDRAVNKHSIARAVEAQFEVKVTEVNTANIRGKSKRVMNLTGKRLRNAEGSRNDFKKAYVTLAEGQALPFFDAIEEEEQQEQKAQEQFDKAAAKQAEKDEKAAAKAAKTDVKKPAAKPKAKPAAKKPAEKAANADEAKPAAEESKHGLAAWRGFRLRKKDKGSK
ncbi:MAG TPA: 50S ribosomal protein L23 [Candidatus Saccharimonadales bacterium]|nr:50S ribosomal protein L23 [Candidatus Saccharimonadales bacterium]